jgi:tetratricopeptide (TPR) repeat protein
MGWYARAVQNWRTLGDPRGLAASLQGSTFGGHNLHTLTVAAPLPTDEVRAAGEESLTLTREIGWRAGEAFVLWSYHGMALGAAGDYAMALPGARQSLDIAREIEHQQWITGAHFTLGVLHAELCDWATARQELTSALDLAQELESLYWIRSAAGWLVSVLTQNGELDAATAVLDAHLDQSTKIDSIAIRILWAAMADLALARGDAERALQTADRLVETAPGSARSPIPRLELLRGQALTALGRYGEGEQALDDALDAATWAGARPLLWRIHAARARLDAAQGKTEVADQALEAAQSVVAELAASVPDDALRAIFLERALAGVTLPSG